MANGLIPACSSDKNNFQPRLGLAWSPQFTSGALHWLFGDPNQSLVSAGFGEITQMAYLNISLDSLNFDGTTLNTVTTKDPTVLSFFPNAPSAAALAAVTPAFGLPPFGRVRPISPNLHNPEMRMFNLGVEHEFTKDLKAGIQYIGQFGFGLFGERDVNAAPVIADPAHPGFFYFGPRPNPNFTAIRTNENSRTSHYNGMLINVEKKFSNHVQFMASYTWAHALTSGEDFFGLSEPGDSVHIRPELGPAFNDIRHAANMGVVLDSGHMTGNRYAGFVANNLGLSWIGQIQSGRPYPVSTGSAGFANGRFFGAGSETQQRPNQLADGTVSVAGIASAFGNNALFANSPASQTMCTAQGFTSAQCASIRNTFLAPAAADGNGAVDALTGETVDFQQVNGNVGRDVGRGSPFTKFDASLHKSYSIPGRENIKLEFRFDAFNVFNHSNFQSYNSNDVLTAMGLSLKTDASGNVIGPNPDFFSCTACQRPNGTFIGSNGQVLHLSNLTHGKVSSSLLNPIFGGPGAPGLGDPGTADIPRTLQLSFHVRF